MSIFLLGTTIKKKEEKKNSQDGQLWCKRTQITTGEMLFLFTSKQQQSAHWDILKTSKTRR